MSNMTNYLENAIANAVVGTASYTSPANVYLSLYTVAPTESTSGTEVSGNGYSRQEITFGNPTDGVVSSTANVTFTASAGNSFSAVAYGVTDASTAGNILFYKNTATVEATDTESLVFQTGDITITFD